MKNISSHFVNLYMYFTLPIDNHTVGGADETAPLAKPSLIASGEASPTRSVSDMRRERSPWLAFHQAASPRSPRIAARELHKYVIGAIGIFSLFAIGFALAVHRCDRASQSQRERTTQIQLGSISQKFGN